MEIIFNKKQIYIIVKKILFITTSHNSFDDRIFYHQAISLAKNNFEVKIISLSSDNISNINNIQIESYNILHKPINYKLNFLLNLIENFNPQITICSEPLAVYATSKYVQKKNCKIIYDITEWYPSKKQLQDLIFFHKIFRFFILGIYNVLAGAKSNGFIYGEIHKQFPFKQLFSQKPSILLPYFPSQKYIYYKQKKALNNVLVFCYTGKISKEKGIENFFKALNVFRNKYSISFKIKIIGQCATNTDSIIFNNLLKTYNFENIEIIEPKEFEKFTKAIADVDICFDLRDNDFENNHCLPIKLFYYFACGKPVIYSNLKSIKKFVEIDNVGFLVNPYNAEQIADCIFEYCKKNSNLYSLHSQNARNIFIEKYNWELIENKFIDFINNL
jgi:glycosyltransferase involved in cell wall biosynthesis